MSKAVIQTQRRGESARRRRPSPVVPLDVPVDIDPPRILTHSGTTTHHAPSPTSPLSPISPWPPPPPPLPPLTPSPPQRSSTSAASAQAGTSGSIGEPPSVLLRPPRETLPSAQEVYGSLAVLMTALGGAVYLIWAIAPDAWLDQCGWTWYPSKDWALVAPCYLMLIVLLTYWSYAALTAYATPGFTSICLVTDPYAGIPYLEPGREPYYHKFAEPRAIPQAVDLPIDLVNRVLFPPRARQAAGGT